MIITVKKYELGDLSSKDAIHYYVYLKDDTGNEQTISVYCSDALKTEWGIEDKDLLFTNLYPLVRAMIISWISKGIAKNINEIYPLSFTTYDAPNKPPAELYSLPDKLLIENTAPVSPGTYAVFICHAIEDRELGNCIKLLLEDFNIKSFVAHDDIELGDIWEPKILETIKDSKIMITLGTKETESSSWVNFETGLGYDKMFPILFDKLTDKVSYIKNKQGIIMDYGNSDSGLLTLIDKVLSRLGVINKRTEEEMKLLPNFLNLKKIILEKYKNMRNAEEMKQSLRVGDLLYIYRMTKGNSSLVEVFNKSNDDLIDLNITLEYFDKAGNSHKKEARVINSYEDPLYARPYICKLIRKNETKYIIDFPRALTKVTITGKESSSGNNFEKIFEVKPEQA